MFNKSEQSREAFLEEAKIKREKRKIEQLKVVQETKKETQIVCVQRIVRGFLARQRFRKDIIAEFDEILPEAKDPAATDSGPVPALKVYRVASLFVRYCDVEQAENRDRFERLCKQLVASLESESPKISYIGVGLNKELSVQWIKHIKALLYKVCVVLQQLRPEIYRDSVHLAICLHTLIAFTSTSTWTLLKGKALQGLRPGMQQLCCNIMGDLVHKGLFLTLRAVLIKGTCNRTVVSLSSVSLNAIMTLSVRILSSANFSETLLIMFVTQIVTVPALIWNIPVESTQTTFSQQQILHKCVALLSDEQSFRFVSNSLKASQTLALLANLVHLFAVEPIETLAELAFPSFTLLVTRLLQGIPSTGKQTKNITKWHELLGWTTADNLRPEDGQQNENLTLVKRQMHMLWSHRTVKVLLGDDLRALANGYEEIEYQAMTTHSGNILKRAFERGATRTTTNKAGKPYRKVGSNEVSKIALVSVMYHAALTTLSQLRLDILTGLCYKDTVLHDFWLLLASFGPNCGIKMFLELHGNVGSPGPAGTSQKPSLPPPLVMLLLFCDCMTHYVTILDDLEMYEQQTPFSLNDYIALSAFLNTFLFRLVESHRENGFDVKTPLFVSAHTLLLSLYRRDCRRQFAPKEHWLIRDIKPSHFLADLEKGKKYAQILLQRTPHIIPLEDRIQLFKKNVHAEKLGEAACSSSASALVTVRRDLIVEDGYRQLAALSPAQIKGTIRVRFINFQGLDEAGIDQDGVFKEFLEETIKKVFDPSLNLFRATTEQRLYPSPTSSVNENHLQLFEFVGRMLGKAVYEGIVVDVPFASFFLSQVLGQTQQALYSCMDELPSLDNELYRSLTFVKHYDGDVVDLGLTFSVDEDVMGKIVTHELVPGGRAKPVTSDNKINYIHYMAYFRMHTQIREQTSAFIRGFRSIVNPDWLSLFSTPELQRLISGDTAPLDLRDLRKHTQYYGGFHDSHRVIVWLWDILAKDLTEEEKKLFLKFVTSCSKPPLLGFSQLEPPFSIRCVEVGDDEDTGDTIGSVIRGFFTIRKKDPLHRLPTSSTCFNLLKLPNYQKKATLREKLRYAISSNTGFELS